ncbi:hypothetical protein AAHZ94_19605 [Streptomyces sp. HSW2009]|uniref:hypothetical protein n=1 Tax=Streptomyces sp. HSW2009 TaxID=3142890 RepID=UPI0032EE4498
MERTPSKLIRVPTDRLRNHLKHHRPGATRQDEPAARAAANALVTVRDERR